MFFSREHCVAHLFITQFQCYYNVIIVTQLQLSAKVVRKIETHVSINKELEIECENELDCSILDNLIMTMQCEKVNFRFSCTERGSYMNMFLWLHDFVTPLNNFFLKL